MLPRLMGRKSPPPRGVKEQEEVVYPAEKG